MNPDCRRHGHHRLRRVREEIRADMRRYMTSSPENLARGDGFLTRLSTLLRPEIVCLALHRTAHWLHVTGWPRAGRAAARLNFLLHKVSITPESCIGPGCRLPHPPGVVFHGRAGEGLTLYSMAVCCAHEDRLDGPPEEGPHLGDRVMLGGHAVLMGPIRVGDDARIEFCVGVTKDIPAGTVVARRLRRPTLRPRPEA